MRHWHNVVLCSHVLGGAQVFALERMLLTDDGALLLCNSSLRRLIREDRRYDAVKIGAVNALDGLASRITLPHLWRASRALAPVLRHGGTLLGDLRSSSIQLVSREASRNSIFVHDNSNYLNLKARWTIALAACRSSSVFFPCQHATARLPLRRALASKLQIEYFGPYCDVEAKVVPRDETLRIVNVGRIEPNKNQRLALDIAEELAQHFAAVELTLVGSASDAAYAESLLRRPPTANLRLTMREVRRSEMMDTLRAHHAVLHTSLVESLPLVLYEANAAGVPFFALDIGGIGELLPSRYLIGQHAPLAANAIMRLLSSTEESARAPQSTTS